MKNILYVLLVAFVMGGCVVGCKSDSNLYSNSEKTVSVNNSQFEDKKNDKDVEQYIKLAKKYSAKPGNENSDLAVEYWKKAATLGDVESQYQVGMHYMFGNREDPNLAFYWFEKAAKLGHKDAQYHLGVIYEQYGDNIKDSLQSAFYWYKKAALQGQKDAYMNLGWCYSKGRGTAKDDKEAFKWFSKAAEDNDGFALMALANCYYNGVGVSKDKAKAIELYKKVISLGDEVTADLAKFELEAIQEEETNEKVKNK